MLTYLVLSFFYLLIASDLFVSILSDRLGKILNPNVLSLISEALIIFELNLNSLVSIYGCNLLLLWNLDRIVIQGLQLLGFPWILGEYHVLSFSFLIVDSLLSQLFSLQFLNFFSSSYSHWICSAIFMSASILSVFIFWRANADLCLASYLLIYLPTGLWASLTFTNPNGWGKCLYNSWRSSSITL